MFLKFIYVAACLSSLLLFMPGEYSIAWMYHILSVHSPVDRHWGRFHLGAVINNVAKKTHAGSSLDTCGVLFVAVFWGGHMLLVVLGRYLEVIQ